jgi:hypothetical protein
MQITLTLKNELVSLSSKLTHILGCPSIVMVNARLFRCPRNGQPRVTMLVLYDEMQEGLTERYRNQGILIRTIFPVISTE